MNKIITLGREFGSGGRELGRRLAEILGIEYYDREILEQIAAHTSLSEEYIQQVVEGRQHQLYPITVNHTLSFGSDYQTKMLQSVFKAQCDILRELADKSDCIIIGRCADYILKDCKPYRLFVYAGIESRIRRCMERSEEGESFTEKEIRKQIIKIDKRRARYYFDHTGKTWGDKINYDLCINTTDQVIKEIVPHIAKML